MEIGFQETKEYFVCCWVHMCDYASLLHSFVLITFPKSSVIKKKNKDLRGTIQFIKNVYLLWLFCFMDFVRNLTQLL